MDSDARHDFAAADAPHSPRNDRRFVYPEARSLPDSEEESDGGEETSPSQYKRDRMREEASHISDGSNGGSSDDDVEVPGEYFPPDEVDLQGEVAPQPHGDFQVKPFFDIDPRREFDFKIIIT